MKLQQQPIDAIHDQLVEVIGIGALALFGVLMVFFGWLKYEDRKNSEGTKPSRRVKRKKK